MSYTRQRLLDLAAGRYVLFVDPDDYLTDGVVVNFIKEIEKTNADALFFKLRYEDSRATYNISITPVFQEYSALDFVNQFDFRGLVSLCQFLFRRSSITEKFNPHIVMAEDFIFLVKQLSRFKKIISTDTVGYIYCNNPVSLTRNSDKRVIAKRSVSYSMAAIELSKLCKDKELQLPAKMRNEITDHINYLSYISVAQCIIGRGNIGTCLSLLKSEGLYPYKNWNERRSLKSRMLYFLLRYEAMARLINALVRLR